MINSYTFNASTSRVVATLDNAVSWCDDHGQDVHVVLYTSSPDLADYVLAPDNRHFCKRTGRPLPIAVLRYDANVTIYISGLHRHLVAHAADDYAWFMYTEDDLAFRWSHVDYLRRWSARLDATRYVPHVMRYEVMPLAGRAPRPALVLDEHPLPFVVVREGGGEVEGRRGDARKADRPAAHASAANAVDLVVLPNPYMAMWHLPRADVQRYVALPSWHGDVDHCPSTDPRVYFATFWLRPHVNLTVPAVDMEAALVQHVSTHYVGEAAPAVVDKRAHATHPLFLHRWYNTDAADFVADVAACVAKGGGGGGGGQSSRRAAGSPPPIQRLGDPLDGACRRCMDAGKSAAVTCVERKQGVPLRYGVACV